MSLPGCALYFVQKTRSFREVEAEVLRDRGSDIGKGGAGSEVHTASNSRTDSENRHVLARMIGRRTQWVAAVIGSEDQHVTGPQSLFQGG